MVEVDSDFEDDFEVADDADLKKKYEEQETQKKLSVDFKDFDLDGDGNITKKELITKLNPSASILEKEEVLPSINRVPYKPHLILCERASPQYKLATELTLLEELAVKGCGKTVSSAPNFDLDGEGNINIREMIAKSRPSAQGNLLRGIVNLSDAA